MRNLLKSIDFFGKEVSFNIDDDKNFKTPLGGVFSIILAATYLFAFLYFGRDLYEKNNPFFLVQNHRLELTPMWNLTNQNFFFGIRVEDENFTTIEDPRFFEIVHTFKHFQKISNSQFIILKEENYFLTNKCNETHMKNHLNMKKNDGVETNSQDFSNFFCPDINHLIGGDFSEKFYGALSFNIKVCDYSTEKRLNLTCASEKEKEEKYKNMFYVGKITHNHILDPSDFLNSITQTFDYTVQKLELGFKKQNFVSLSINILKTDSNIIGVEYKDKAFLQIDNERTDFTTIDNSSVISENQILMSRNTNNHIRSYIKLQQVIAIVGGFSTLSMKVLSIIYSFYINSIFYQFMVNSIIEVNKDCNLEINKGLKSNQYNNISNTLGLVSTFRREIKLDQKRILAGSPSFREKKFKLSFCQSLIDSYYRKKIIIKKVNFSDERETIRSLFNMEISKKLDIINYFILFEDLNIIKNAF